jgi:hypothetical protein
MTHIYLLHEHANTDHCSDCLHEAYESCGPLHTYLVVETTEINDDIPSAIYSEVVLCEECANDIKGDY